VEIRRHCRERLRYGERLWRIAARDAQFNGILIVDGLGRRKWNYSELKNPRRKEMGVTRGLYSSIGEGEITIFVGNSPCGQRDGKSGDPFLCFLHELGHHRQRVRGVFLPTNRKQTWEISRKEWSEDPLEISADRYMRRLAYRYLGCSIDQAE